MNNKVSNNLIVNYEVKKFMSVIYTGGNISISSKENFFVSCAENKANIIDFKNGEILTEIEGVHFIIL
jgi:hypothetical protein